MGQSIFKTSCPRDCFSGCDLKVHVEDGKIVKVEGGGQNRATEGKLCVKGLSYPDYVYSPNRLAYPMIREGKRGEGKFKRVSWDAAIKEITKNLKTVKDTTGPLGLLHFESGGCMGMMSDYFKSFIHQFGGYSTVSGNLCYSAGIEAVKLTYGENKQNAPWDLENAGLIVIWGKNPASTNVHEMKIINNALAKGSKLITIDPINTLPSIKSNLHIPIKPGTDGTLALCIINLLIQKGSVDREFVENYTLGFDRLKQHVSSYSAAYASKVCSIDEALIHEMVRLIEEAKPMTLVCGFGMQRYRKGGQTVRAVSMIPALTGDIGIKGGGFKFANKRWRALNWPFVSQNAVEIRSDFAASQFGKAIEEYQNPGIKMVWIERGNPLAMNPDIIGLKRSLDKVDCVVVVDQFMTDTAKYADIVLPAQSFFEFEDVFSGYWTPYLNYFGKVIEPFGESKNESEIYRMLGQSMGCDMSYLPEYNSDTINEALKRSNIDVTVEELREGPYLGSNTDIAYEDRVFKTPSGKIELYCDRMESEWGQNPLPDFMEESYEIKSNAEYPLRFLTTHARERIHSQFGEIKAAAAYSEKPYMLINPADADTRNIKDGDRVEIFNEKARINVFAKITPDIKPGVVNVYEGLSEICKASVNLLTSQYASDIGFGAAFYDCFVEVEKSES